MCGDSEVGEYPGRITEVDCKYAIECLSAKHARCTVEECVSFGSSALRAGCKLCNVVCSSCGVALLEGLDSWSNGKTHACKCC